MFASLYCNFIEVDWTNVARRDGVGALWPTARDAVARSYREWRRERDLAAVADALHELSDRQLRLIGMQRETVDQDVSALADWIAARDALGNGLGGWGADRVEGAPKLLTYLSRGQAPGGQASNGHASDSHAANGHASNGQARRGQAARPATEPGVEVPGSTAFASFERRPSTAASEV